MTNEEMHRLYVSSSATLYKRLDYLQITYLWLSQNQSLMDTKDCYIMNVTPVCVDKILSLYVFLCIISDIIHMLK